MQRLEKGSIWLRWDKRKKLIELLTDDDVSHYLTPQEALCLQLTLFRLIPRKEAHAILERFGTTH